MSEWSSALQGPETLLGKKSKERKRTKALYVLTTRVGVEISQQRKGTLVNWGQGTGAKSHQATGISREVYSGGGGGVGRAIQRLL